MSGSENKSHLKSSFLAAATVVVAVLSAAVLLTVEDVSPSSLVTASVAVGP